MICQYFLNMCHFINDKTSGSCMMGHHLIFSALWDSTWTRLCVNSGYDLNPLDFWQWGRLKTLVYSTLINDLEVLQQQVENDSGDSSETRNFRQSAFLCANWKLWWNEWEPHKISCYKHHTNIAVLGFWMYIEWDFSFKVCTVPPQGL